MTTAEGVGSGVTGRHSSPDNRSRPGRSGERTQRPSKARAKAMRPWYRKQRFAVPLVLVALIVVLSALSGGEDGSQVAETSAGSGTVESEPAALEESTPEDEAEPDVVEDEPEPEPEMTVTQEQAVQSASSYLDIGGFSRRALINQLTSDAGEGFERADAVFAIRQLRPDWNAEAVESAESYLDLSGFSRRGLINQLTSNAGDGYTQAQAEFAIRQLRPDWNAEAVESAESYLDIGGFSRQSLIEQLTSSAGDGYTRPQAEYAVDQVGL